MVDKEQILNDGELTLVLFTASFLAAEAKGSITLSKLFAAIYITCYDQLQIYCNDWKGIIRFIKYECGLEKPTWLYWARVDEALNSGKGYGMFTVEPEVNNLLGLASEKTVISGRQFVSVFDVLQAISEQHHIELCQRFISAGIDLEQTSRGR